MEAQTSEVFKCSDCTSEFTKRMDYNRHRKKHDRPYKCGICDKGFALNADLRRHRDSHRHRSSVAKWLCPKCPKTLPRKDHVFRHLRNKHGWRKQDSDDINIPIKPKQDVEKNAETGLELLEAAIQHDVEGLSRLIQNGANIESRDDSGRTPLSWAATRGYQAIVQLLLDNGADIEQKDSRGRTPLSWAASEGHEAVVQLLLDKGAYIESKDSPWNQTPLLWAAKKGHEAIMQLLLDRGANVNARDSFGYTPLYYATYRGDKAII